MNTHPNYIIISPVKDEERYVEATLKSVTAQTVKPSQWIIVDDGSVDGTPELIERYRQQNSWIKVMNTNRDAARRPGRAEIVAFLRAYRTIENQDFDFIVKLDCDVELPAKYFETLLARFAEDET